MNLNVFYYKCFDPEKLGELLIKSGTKGEIHFEFVSDNLRQVATGYDYFETLCNLREKLEGIDVELRLNGSSIDVYPSGMATDMGFGQVSYRLHSGLHSSAKDLVNIFDFDRLRYKKSTVQEQRDYYESWRASKKKSVYLQPRNYISEIIANSKFIFFWGHQSSIDEVITKSCLSQWWPIKFTKDDKIYHSAEQWMMAEKARIFLDKDSEQKILATTSPKTAKALGRKVSNFNEDVWALKSYSIVVEGNLLKFSQNKLLGNFLLSTGEAVLVEASPVDKLWGAGLAEMDDRILDPMNWTGKNYLGFALMEVRSILSRVNSQV
jgi:hypothetical protein